MARFVLCFPCLVIVQVIHIPIRWNYDDMTSLQTVLYPSVPDKCSR